MFEATQFSFETYTIPTRVPGWEVCKKITVETSIT